jgi:hypothetical protein
MFLAYQEKLKKIDALEHKLEEKVLEKRQRALNLLDEMCNVRHTTLRIFVSHEYLREQKEQQEKSTWKLVIEGKQLIPALDHIAAQKIDKYQTDKASKENRQYVIQQTDMYTDIHKLQLEMDKMKTREKIATRFVYDREGEDLIQPLLFTYFWDRISVSFQPFSREVMRPLSDDDEEEEGEDEDNCNDSAAIGKKRKRLSTSAVISNSNNSDNSSPAKKKFHKLQRQKMRELQQLNTEKTDFQPNGTPSNFVWNRSTSQKVATNTASATSASSYNTAPTSSNNASTNTNGATAGAGTAASNSTTGKAESTAENNITPPSPSIKVPSNNQDAHAFHVLFEQDHTTSSPNQINTETITEHMVVATIRLHRRTNYNNASGHNSTLNTEPSSMTSSTTLLGMNDTSTGINSSPGGTGTNYHEQTYKLSKVLLNTLFTCFLPKNNKKISSAATVADNIGTNASSNGGDISTTTNNKAPSSVPPIDNDINIPKVFTMDEILTAFYIYITDNKLQQKPPSEASTSSAAVGNASTSATTGSQNNDPSTLATATIAANKSSSPTLIHNDTKLQTIFNQPTMEFHQIKSLLLTKNLITPTILGTPGDAPIVLTYIMKEDNASLEPMYIYDDEVIQVVDKEKVDQIVKTESDDNNDAECPEKKNNNADVEKKDEKEKNIQIENNQASVVSKQGKGDDEMKEINETENKKEDMDTTITSSSSNKKSESTPPNKRRKVSNTSKSRNQSKKATQTDHLTHIPNLLSCDIDIDVPHLFHSRTREILRRIKIREYEYASCRTKALRLVQHSRVSENDAKMLLEDVIRGKAMSKDHIPVCLALAKASQSGSEARIGSHIDARMSMLMGRLEHHTRNAQACWDLVKHCRREGNK